MPTIYTLPADLVLGAGKSIGQAEREQEAFRNGMEEKRLDLAKQQLEMARQARIAAIREQERRDIIQQNQFNQNLNERAREFNNNLGIRTSSLNQANNQFNQNLAEKKNEFNRELSATEKQREFQNTLAAKREKRLSGNTSTIESLSKTFKPDLARFERGEITKEDLLKKYPYSWYKKPIEQSAKTVITRKKMLVKPIKQTRWYHLIARAKKGYAAMNPATLAASQEIKTYGDLVDLLKNKDALAQAGVNVSGLIDYYTPEINQLKKAVK